MSDRVCLDVRTNDKSGRALNPSLSVTGARGEGERAELRWRTRVLSNEIRDHIFGPNNPKHYKRWIAVTFGIKIMHTWLVKTEFQ